MFYIKNNKLGKILTTALSLICALALSAPAFADQSAGLDTESTIPVTISAEATTFDVTVPTSFPTSVDPETGETTNPDEVKITNNSAAPIYVSRIEVKKYDDWKLGGFAEDLRNYKVDDNVIGVSVKPIGGRSAGTGGTALVTTKNGGAESQVLLSTKSDEWVIDAKNNGTTDELTIDYDTNATPVSVKLTNKQVASIVITIAWNK